jgi:small subunit ribosomal protein S16
MAVFKAACFYPSKNDIPCPMIKLRLKRFGKKREASYRIVAMNSDARRDGRPLEELGFYNPRTDETRLDVPGIVRRLQQGAQPTKTVKHILEKANVFEQLNAQA